MKVKEAIVMPRNKKKKKDTGQTVGLTKQTVWNIKKKQLEVVFKIPHK